MKLKYIEQGDSAIVLTAGEIGPTIQRTSASWTSIA